MPSTAISYRTISVKRDRRRIVHVTLARAGVGNAVNATMMAELKDAFDRIAMSAAPRAIILSGAGAAFCAGADPGWIYGAADAAGHAGSIPHQFSNLIRTIGQCPQPVIGIAHGMVYGAGIALCSACDIVIAAPATRFSVSEPCSRSEANAIERYLIDTVAGNTVLKLALMQTTFGPVFAEKIGLVHHVVEPENMSAAVSAILERAPRRTAPESLRHEQTPAEAACRDMADAVGSHEKTTPEPGAVAAAFTERLSVLKTCASGWPDRKSIR
jgi:methylglutaconyl-CoA hydratase